ncbi:hypothetical protein R3P38DRAFT_2627941 [Favolaschia claudopus]|uniref:F-box domain-containing protein n=1 Tax=Favolaschia claudopus TaxID=2862362 RepID=A0AAW0B9T4_9AGAR
MLNIPQELTDKIIDCLHDDKPSLYLVCWAWVPATRFHIFADITLRRSWSRMMHPQYRPFVDMLATDSCTFAPFVVSLTLEDLDQTLEAELEISPLFTTLAKLKTVKALTFRRLGSLGEQPLYSFLPRLPSLTEISLQSVKLASADQLFTILEMCPSLTSLKLVSVSWELSTASAVYARRTSIRKLSIIGCPPHEFFYAFAPAHSSSRLTCTSLAIQSIVSADVENIVGLLNCTSETLVHLLLGFDGWDDDVEGLFFVHMDLANHKRLVSLRICDIQANDEPKLERLLTMIHNALRAPLLEVLELVLMCSTRSVMEEIPWGRIDNLISSLHPDSLRHVAFSFRGLYISDDTRAATVVDIMRQLRKCSASDFEVVITL